MARELTRSLGLWAAIATAVGIVVSSSALVSLGEGFGLGGRGFTVAMVAALFLNVCVAFTFSELAGLIPRAGGLNRYTMPAMGSFMSMIAVISGYVLVTLFAGSAEAGIAGMVFTDVTGIGLDPLFISVVLVFLLCAVNLLGAKVFGWVQIGLATALIASTMMLGLIGLTGVGSGEPVEAAVEFNPMGMGVLSLIALAFWLFVGVEFVTPLAEEIKKPKVYIPLAMILGLVIIFVVDVVFGFAALRYALPDELLGTGSPHVFAAEAVAGRTGFLWMGIVTILATASTLNTLIISISRMLFSMAEEGEMPRVLARLNRRGSPWLAIAFLGLLFIMFLVIGITDGDSVVTFILAGSFCWMLSYVIAHLNVIILRFRYPHASRVFRSPGGVAFQVIGILGLLFVMANIAPSPEQSVEVYAYAIGFLVLTVSFSLVWVKFVMRKGLFETTPLDELVIRTDEQPSKQLD